MRSSGDPTHHFDAKAEWEWWRTHRCFIGIEKDRLKSTGRSLKVLKKTEKGLLTEYQWSFSFWEKSPATGGCFTDRQMLSNVDLTSQAGLNGSKIYRENYLNLCSGGNR